MLQYINLNKPNAISGKRIIVIVNVDSIIGLALDWAVSECENELWKQYDECMHAADEDDSVSMPPRPSEYLRDYQFSTKFSPSTNWQQGGEIIARERIDLLADKSAPDMWIASVARYQNGTRLVGWRVLQYGPTPLIAAMRCYVASKMGDKIKIPPEIKNHLA